MVEIRITCINKDNGNHDNPHEAITHYGWINEANNEKGKGERQIIVNWVKKGNRAYVKDTKGNMAYCEIRKSSRGVEFLQTIADNKYFDNLLSLPECK